MADQHGVYVAMRREDVRPQAFVACLRPDCGRVRWRRFICSAETPPHGALREGEGSLLTLGGDTLYYNTNLGAVAALRVDDGRPRWLSLYLRELRGKSGKVAPHCCRVLNPCVLDRGTLLVAPTDSPCIFAFDAATGTTLWQSEAKETSEIAYLLGTAGDWLLAGGRSLYWISLKGKDRGRVKHGWPDGDLKPSCGRGLLAGNCLMWPTRDKIYIFDHQTAQLRRTIDLAALGATRRQSASGRRVTTNSQREGVNYDEAQSF